MADIGDKDYNLNENKVAVIMAIDVSSSMNSHIDELTERYNSFILAMKSDKKVNQCLDLATVTFASDINVIDFSSIKDVKKMHFEAYGSTKMTEALERSLNMAKDRTRDYRNRGITCYKPWIILMTDGYPDNPASLSDIAKKIRENEKEGKIHMFCVGMGDGYNKETLKELSDKCFAIRNWEFEQFFGWLTKSMAVVSKSRPGETGAICDTGKECQDMFNAFMGQF